MTTPEQSPPPVPTPTQHLATLIRERFEESSFLREQDLALLESGLLAGSLSAEDWLAFAENALASESRYGAED